MRLMSHVAPSSTRLFIGMMSGTSLDGVDTVLVRQSPTGQMQQIGQDFLPYPEDLKQAALDLHTPASNELHQAALLANRLASLYATAVARLLAQSDLSPSQITAIGCHGQTIRHCPDLPDGDAYTLQLGNHARLAELTGITVVGDFRSRDIAAGGQGAPLVPAFHQAVFAHPQKNRAIVNIGGIANISWLPVHGTVTGFDSGPGNMLIDAWTQQHLGTPYDANGQWASSGTLNADCLQTMLAEPFLSSPPPKSTGRDLFNATWLARQLPQKADQSANIARTLLELTARSIAEALARDCPGVEEVYVCGGGVHNSLLMQRLQQLCPCPLQPTDTLGIGADWVEAVAFAWLAQRCIDGLPGNLPSVTGAAGTRTLGAIYPA